MSVRLDFKPTIDLIYATRRFVCSYFEPLIGDPDALSRIGLATHEMLENILKYATDGRSVTNIELVPEQGKSVLSIATTSRVTDTRRAGLEEIFAEMAHAADANAYYQLTIGRSRKRKIGSGLGLARIWAEAEMPLSIAFDGEWVTIRATTEIGTWSAA